MKKLYMTIIILTYSMLIFQTTVFAANLNDTSSESMISDTSSVSSQPSPEISDMNNAQTENAQKYPTEDQKQTVGIITLIFSLILIGVSGIAVILPNHGRRR